MRLGLFTRLSVFVLGFAFVPTLPLRAVDAAPASTLPGFSGVTHDANGYWNFTFEQLASFSYPTPTEENSPKPNSLEGIPANIRALEGQRVAIEGYMLPVKLDNGAVVEFMLIRSPMTCCYGVMPAMNEWVIVKMKDTKTQSTMDVPLKAYGTLHVGAMYEGSTFTGVYELDGEKVALQ